MVGVIGNDFGDEHLNRLRTREIDLEGVQKDASGPTFSGKENIMKNFNRRDTLDIQLNVFESFRPDLPDSYKDSSYVLLGNIHPALQAHVPPVEGSALLLLIRLIYGLISREVHSLN